jgi:Uma2 family endonuclease
MATVAEAPERLLTAEEYLLIDLDEPSELVRGRIVTMPVPFPIHGYVCGRTARLIGNYVEDHDLGRIMTNDSGVITERGPDTVRGPDVSFYSYQRLPKGPIPKGYLAVSPEVAFEVRSENDRWPTIIAKVAEYLNADVLVVCILDPEPQTAHVYFADKPSQILTADQEFALPELLGDFRVAVRKFFE